MTLTTLFCGKKLVSRTRLYLYFSLGKKFSANDDSLDGSYVPIYTSPHIRKTIDPSWVDATLRIVHLVGSKQDLNTNLKIEVHDWDRIKEHELIGEVTVCIISCSEGRSFDLPNF